MAQRFPTLCRLNYWSTAFICDLSALSEIPNGFYTDAEIIEDNTFAVGNRLNNAPENSFNLWTTYEIQQGAWRGFGVGVGLFYKGETQGDLENSFTVPSYLRTDASVFYKRDEFRAAINVRNLFDRNYYEFATGRTSVYAAEPLTVQGTISWEF